jgi:PAS domain S-box-containing protein
VNEVWFDDADVRTLMESAPDALLVVEGDRIVHASSKAAAATGYTVVELESMPVGNLLPKDSRKRHILLRQEYQQTPEIRWMGQGRGNLRLRRADGEIRRIEAGLQPAIIRGRPVTIVWVRDITDRIVEFDEKKLLKVLVNFFREVT